MIPQDQPDVQALLYSDRALQNLLHKLKRANLNAAGLREVRPSAVEQLILHPDGRFRSFWNVFLAVLLVRGPCSWAQRACAA